MLFCVQNRAPADLPRVRLLSRDNVAYIPPLVRKIKQAERRQKETIATESTGPRHCRSPPFVVSHVPLRCTTRGVQITQHPIRGRPGQPERVTSITVRISLTRQLELHSARAHRNELSMQLVRAGRSETSTRRGGGAAPPAAAPLPRLHGVPDPLKPTESARLF